VPARGDQRSHTEKIREHVHQARRVLDLTIDYYKQFKFKHAGAQLASQRLFESRCARISRRPTPIAITRSPSTPSPLKERSSDDVEANAAVERCRSRTQAVTKPARITCPREHECASPPACR